MASSTAMKRYQRRVLALSLLYAAFLMLAIYGFRHALLSGPLAVLAALAPALPIIGIFVAIGRYLVEERDEYLRVLMVRQTLWASGVALSIATAWGFLESFEIVGHVEAYYVAVLWFAGLGLGACINRLTMGATEPC